jgi:hypothetical protein
MASERVTLFDPPPLDDNKAPIENVLELTPILDIGPVRAKKASFPFSLSLISSSSTLNSGCVMN